MALRSTCSATHFALLSVLVGLASAILPARSAIAQCGIELEPAEAATYTKPTDVLVNGNLALMGAASHEGPNGEGAVFVFEHDGTDWHQTGSLFASDAPIATYFGSDLDKSGDVIVVGAINKRTNDIYASGGAYVFRKTGSTWIEEAILVAPVPRDVDQFGRRVAISGNVIAVSSATCCDSSLKTGAVHIFRYDGANWLHSEEITGSDSGEDDLFGLALALDADRLLVGAPEHDLPVQDGGAAYLFTYDGAQWNEDLKFSPADPLEGAAFGASIASRDDFLAIGAPGWGGSPGKVYIYHEIGTAWIPQDTLIAPAPEDTDRFGNDLAMDAGLLAIAARNADNPVDPDGGMVYVYGLGGDGSVRTAFYPVQETRFFGANLSLSNEWLMADAHFSYSSGNSYLFPIGLPGPDCDLDGISDACGLDCDDSGIPDQCEASNDCDANGLVDTCDIAFGFLQDCDADWVPDDCEDDDWQSLDCNNDMIPDLCNIAGGVSADCNTNDIPDECDVGTGTSTDCQSNGVPDECETDCNVNDIPDECDIAAGSSDDCNADAIPDDCQPVEDCNNNSVTDICDIGAGTEVDCNRNLRPDSCDLGDGTSTDDNANGIPDGCEGPPMPDATFHIDGSVRTCATDADCLVGLSPTSEVYCVLPPAGVGGDGTCYVQRNKYISLDPNPDIAGAQPARRVSLVLGGGGTAVLGWVGGPMLRTVAGPEPSPQLLSRIEADPHYRDWTADNEGLPWVDPTVHLGDCEIVPGYAYHVQSIPSGANIFDEANYSAPLELRTVTDYGDVAGSSVGHPPDRNRNFKDINAVLRGFQSVQLEAKVWLDLWGSYASPSAPDFYDISLSDISSAIVGFQGESYPYSGPLDCPDQLNP